MKIKSNAKINLNLKITGIKDGYHMLDSIFVPINIYDDIEIVESDKDEIIGMNIDMHDNIMYKAINLVRKEFNINKKFKISINKNIPMQAGLGGGSSNAASILKALNEMLSLNSSKKELARMGLELGSDVPFFIFNEPSKVEGRGEIITRLKNFEKIHGVLVFDDMYFSTKDVYHIYDLLSNKEIINNDLELAARTMIRGDRIIDIENKLLECGAYQASLTGSGGAIFGLFYKKEDVASAAHMLKSKYAYVKSFESLN